MKNYPSDVWLSPALHLRLNQEAEFEGAAKPHFWFVVPNTDNPRAEIELRNYQPGMFDLDPHQMQKVLASQIRQTLQKELHHDGAWIVGWTNPPTSDHAIRTDGDNVWGRMVMLWLDEDGDPQFPVETSLPVIEIIQSGAAYYATLCEQAWEQWSEQFGKKALKNDFGLTDADMVCPVMESLKTKH